MKPWYRQFWPWFVIALPAVSVIASLCTLFIALDRPDTLVREDWYQGGQHINEELALDDAAADRHVSAQLSVKLNGDVAAEVHMEEGPLPGTLVLELHHLSHAARDVRADLRGDGSGHFEGHASGRVDAGMWDASMIAADWRLQSRIALPAEGARLQAGP